VGEQRSRGVEGRKKEKKRKGRKREKRGRVRVRPDGSEVDDPMREMRSYRDKR
jgi:hypothetical protein